MIVFNIKCKEDKIRKYAQQYVSRVSLAKHMVRKHLIKLDKTIDIYVESDDVDHNDAFCVKYKPDDNHYMFRIAEQLYSIVDICIKRAEDNG